MEEQECSSGREAPHADAAPQDIQAKSDAPRLTRRQLLVQSLTPLVAAGLGEGISEPEEIEVTRHRVPMRGLQAPTRVVQLTDLHRSWCVPEDFIAHVVARTNALKPDLVLLTGDFITRSADYAQSCAEQLGQLRAPLGRYGVLGNHDYAASGGYGAITVAIRLAEVGIGLLINRNEPLANGLWLVGLDDCWMGRPDPVAAFDGVPRDQPTLAMTHNPDLFGTLRRYPCLTLAGHTHGGQINIPCVTRMLIDTRARYLRGWFRAPEMPGRMYVSRGLGVVGIPMRFRSRPEIAVFDLLPA